MLNRPTMELTVIGALQGTLPRLRKNSFAACILTSAAEAAPENKPVIAALNCVRGNLCRLSEARSFFPLFLGLTSL